MNALASVPAIVEKTSDEESARREVISLWLSFQESSRAEEDASQECRRRLFALGGKLAIERDRYPLKGPKARAWGDFLVSCGIESQRASEAMRYAGYIEKVCPPGGDTLTQAVELPSLYEAGIKERTKPKVETEPETEAPFHVLTAVGKLKERVATIVATWPESHRIIAPDVLRDLAKEMEQE